MLNIKSKSDLRWDIISLGEVMLRFDPGDERLRSTRSFRVYEGGGEYNVARNLAKCFRLDAAIVTALADNEIGRLVEDLITQGRVDTSQINWRECDGISKSVRNGMYFWERGFGIRPPAGCSDRGNTAVSQLRPGDIDLKRLFIEQGTRWFHTGGIFAGLSETTAEVAAEAMKTAHDAGSIVSYDLNYRDSLWSTRGGRDAANELNSRLLDFADVVFGVEGFDASLDAYDESKFRVAVEQMRRRHPSLQIIATPLRAIHNASSHDLSGVCFAGEEILRGPVFTNIHVLDRVGSGDAFAAGLTAELLNAGDARQGIATATAAAAFALTTPGDSLDCTPRDLIRLIETGNSGSIR